MNILLVVLILFLIICIISIVMCHYSIKVTRYNIKSEKISNNFESIKIVHLSDLHSRDFGKNNLRLMFKIAKECPDIIVMTGDMINGEKEDIYNLEKILKTIISKLNNVKIYYIIGNRELKLKKEEYCELKSILNKNNVVLLENSNNTLGENICIYGVNHYKLDIEEYYSKFSEYISKKNIESNKNIENITGALDKRKYNILLIHDPKDFNEYSKCGFDLILAGHIHGGVIRLPIINKGVLSPERKIFPKYDSGIYEDNQSYMCVSRGLGYGTIPFRIFNRPEIISVKIGNF